ncbi:MAG: methyltransferase domain-containing protein [Magnetococcales bacterium]|nr:methyltransferase domain-containing protein [Magnetococcales bacterium]
MTMEAHVLSRYAEGARRVEADLCCPVSYDAQLLELLPREIVERDYGCGDPSRYVRSGDVVLDLGSGGGKICYLAAVLTGAAGRVIGVDMNDEMLALARRHQPEMAAKLGGDRVCFRKGRIQDLAEDLEGVADYLAAHPVVDGASLAAFELERARRRREEPMIPDGSVDLVLSNCVLNLVDDGEKPRLVREIFRVLRPGGRAAISDIVSDGPIPERLKRDPELWSGCLSGAFVEHEFLRAFREAGFVGATLDKWDDAPWRVVEGIEFRSATLTAVKPLAFDGRAERGHWVIYRGPMAWVEDEFGGRYAAGERTPVSAEVFARLSREPYAGMFILIHPGRPKSQIQVAGCVPGGGCC